MKDVNNNILNYIKWRGDISFDQKELNEIDAAVFSALSYEIFDEIFEKYESLSIHELSNVFFSMYDEEKIKTRKLLSVQSYEVLKRMGSSERYKDLLVSNYVNEINDTLNIQFSAMTLEYKNKWNYIVFRGTDENFIGWEEDFAMLYQDVIEGAKKATNYVQTVVNKEIHPHSLYIGGHSKGGHLATYAAGHVSEEIQNRIVRVDSFDGPGFSEEIWNEKGMQNILHKITTFIPEDSFFGRWMEHEGKVQVIQSAGKGLRQHTLYRWEVDVTRFIYKESVSENSIKASEKFNEIINTHTQAELKEISEMLFSVFDTLEIKTLMDLSKMSPSLFLKAIGELRNLDAKTIKLIGDIIGIVWDISISIK